MKFLRKLAFVSAASLVLTGTIAAMPAEVGVTAEAASVQGAAEAFLDTGYDSKYVTIHSTGTGFRMNGRTYYQGILFHDTFYDAQISYDVTETEQISFTIGHLDNSSANSATVSIYLDGEEYDRINLTWTMPLKEYTIDTADSSELKIAVSRGSLSSGYALADVSVDGAQPDKTCTVPEYDSAAQFMESGFGKSYTTVNNTTSKIPAFKMNGRGYYQGLTFDETFYDAKVCFNVENVDEVSFTMGHIDGSRENTATVTVYLDNMEYDKFSLTWAMSLKEYTIDTTDSAVLRIAVSRSSLSSGYAFADISVDGAQPDKTCTVPKYDSAAQFMESGFGQSYTTVNNTTSKIPAFKMNGRGYYQGLTFDETFYDAKVCFNVETVDEVSFTVGHIDGSREGKASVTIYLDNMEYDKFDLTWANPLMEYTVDTTDSVVLRIAVSRSSLSSGYAFADISVDSAQPDKTCTVPEYESAEAFIESGFGLSNASVHNTTTKLPAFRMNEQGFYQGIAFQNNYSEAKISFNVENIDGMSFTIGHIDDSDTYAAALKLYLDNVLADTVALTGDMENQEYQINTRGAGLLHIVLERSYLSSGYALGDVAITAGGGESLPETGDVDGDGEISVNDSQLALIWAAEVMVGNEPEISPAQRAAADIDGDGKLTVSDSQFILNYYAQVKLAGNDVTWDDIISGNF